MYNEQLVVQLVVDLLAYNKLNNKKAELSQR